MFYDRFLVIAAVLLASVGLRGQEVYRASDPDVFAKLAYDTSPTVQNDGSRHICIAISRDANYHIVRSLPDGQSQRLQGKLLQEQFDQLKKLLGAGEFRVLSGDHGGLIRAEAQTFAADVPRRDARNDDSVQRLRWLTADGENPFPNPVTKVVDWLKGFNPKDGESFVYAEFPDVCPSGGLRFLQPSVATNGRP